MNPLILKIVTSLLTHGISSKSNSLKPTKDNGNFFSIVKNILDSSGKKSFDKYSGAHELKSSQGKTRPHFYLEALRKRLLAKGKPLTEYTLNRKDLPLFKNFLYHSGFSQEKVDQFFKELMQDNPQGDINLSQLFLKMDSLVPPKKKGDQMAILEPSAIPHIESMLRNLGFTPKELGHLFNSAKIEGGYIDVHKLVLNLKEAGGKINSQNQATIDRNLSHRISHRREGAWVNKTDKERAGQLTLKDFIASLEQTIGDLGEDNKLPSEVKNDIEKILGRVVLSDEKYVFKDKSSGIGNLVEKTSLQYALRNGENPDNKKRLLSALVDKENAVEKADLPSTSEGKNNFIDKKVALSQQNEKVNSNDGSTNTETFHKSKRAGRPYDLDDRQSFNRMVKEDSHAIKSATVAADTFGHKVNSIFSNSIHTVKQNENLVKDFLPAYLVDQAGKQISKSILRGDKVLKLRLKPPELGVLRIEMDIQDNVLKLGVIAEKNSVKDLLLSKVFELREALIEQGVKLERIDIQIRHDFDQSLTDSDGGLKEGQRWKQEPNRETSTAKNTGEGLQSESSSMKADNHLLDLVA